TADDRPGITSIVNAASFSSTIGPGAWITISGKNFATTTTQAATATLPTSLGGVSVQLSGVGAVHAALINYVSPTQINALVPHELATTFFGDKSAQLTITTGTGSVSSPIDCQALSPGLFSYGPNKYAAAVFPDGVIVGTTPGTRPASAGSVI